MTFSIINTVELFFIFLHRIFLAPYITFLYQHHHKFIFADGFKLCDQSLLSNTIIFNIGSLKHWSSMHASLIIYFLFISNVFRLFISCWSINQQSQHYRYWLIININCLKSSITFRNPSFDHLPTASLLTVDQWAFSWIRIRTISFYQIIIVSAIVIYS